MSNPIPDTGRRQVTSPWDALIFVATLTAIVVMRIFGIETGAVVSLAGPVIAAVFLGQVVQSRSDRQDQELSQIRQSATAAATQTNGMLDERMRRAVRDVLAESATVTAAPPQPVAVEYSGTPADVPADDPPIYQETIQNE